MVLSKSMSPVLSSLGTGDREKVRDIGHIVVLSCRNGSLILGVGWSRVVRGKVKVGRGFVVRERTDRRTNRGQRWDRRSDYGCGCK